MKSPDQRQMVPGFRHRPGNHCGSTALRNLLGHHGIELSEEMAFGLAAGPSFYYLTLEQGSPTRWTNGRTGQLEESFLNLTEAPLELRTFGDPDESWVAARQSVDEGRPALLLTDIYYLDHYGNSAHFPGHGLVLAGYDQDHAYVADTAFEDLQQTGLDGLQRARHAEQPGVPLQGHMFTVSGEAPADLRSAAPRAVAKAAREMWEPSLGEYAGIPALRRLAAEVADWPREAADWQWCARFGYQVIERRGTGGGNFRLMYCRFLTEAGFEEQAPLAAEAAAAWSALGEEFQIASRQAEPVPETWKRIGSRAGEVLAAEERLWGTLGEAAGAE